MLNVFQKLLKDGAVKSLLQRILTATIGDRAAENKEDADRKKLEGIIPSELIGSQDGDKIEGSPWVWTGGTDPYIIELESGKNLLELGYSKKDLQKMVKQIKAKVNELNGTTAQKEAELQANKEKKEAAAVEKQKNKEAEEAKRQQAKKEKREKEIQSFIDRSGLHPLGKNNTKAKWNSKANRDEHVNPDGTLKHQDDYPNLTETEFLKLAKKLADTPIDGKEILGYGNESPITGEPTICRYNVKTGDYVKMNADGLVTMFKFRENWSKEKLQSKGVKSRYEYYEKMQGIVKFQNGDEF